MIFMMFFIVCIIVISIFMIIAFILINIKSYGEKYIININELQNNNSISSNGELQTNNGIENNDNLKSDRYIIIVLGAGIREDGTPSDILKDRLKTSVEAFENNCVNTVILSGDHSSEKYNEVGAMKNYILKYNINEEDILLDHAGFSTYDTIYRAKEIFKVKNAIIVTNEYHLPRALYIARRLGIVAYGIKSDKRKYDLMKRYKKREVFAQLKDFFYVNILKPKSNY